MTNQHCPIYCELMQAADNCMDEADEILDHALILREHNRIDEEGYYLLISRVTEKQNKYVELRDQAIDADHWYWMGQQHIEDDLRAKDWHEQHYSERP